MIYSWHHHRARKQRLRRKQKRKSQTKQVPIHAPQKTSVKTQQKKQVLRALQKKVKKSASTQVEAVVVSIMGLRRVKKSDGRGGACADVLVMWEDGGFTWESHSRMQKHVPHLLQDFKNKIPPVDRTKVFYVLADCQCHVDKLLGEEAEAQAQAEKAKKREQDKEEEQEEEAADEDD